MSAGKVTVALLRSLSNYPLNINKEIIVALSVHTATMTADPGPPIQCVYEDANKTLSVFGFTHCFTYYSDICLVTSKISC